MTCAPFMPLCIVHMVVHVWWGWIPERISGYLRVLVGLRRYNILAALGIPHKGQERWTEVQGLPTVPVCQQPNYNTHQRAHDCQELQHRNCKHKLLHQRRERSKSARCLALFQSCEARIKKPQKQARQFYQRDICSAQIHTLQEGTASNSGSAPAGAAALGGNSCKTSFTEFRIPASCQFALLAPSRSKSKDAVEATLRRDVSSSKARQRRQLSPFVC